MSFFRTKREPVLRPISTWTFGSHAGRRASWFLVCCFSVAAVATATPPDEAAAGDKPSVHVEREQAANMRNLQNREQANLEEQLFDARISSPGKKGQVQPKQELERLIALVSSIEFEKLDETTEPLAPAEPPATPNEPNKTKATVIMEPGPNEPARQEVTTATTAGGISRQTLQMLADLSKHPESVVEPFGLAEVLYAEGIEAMAATFYQEALKRKATDDAWSAEDRAWTMFQLGNCLREQEPAAAGKLYTDLLAEFPDCPWAAVVKARQKLVEWYEQEKPWALIDSSISAGTDASVSQVEQ
jgi:hypothetical protein